MNWVGSGFVTIIIYGSFGTGNPEQEFTLLTESGLEILTESGLPILVEH